MNLRDFLVALSTDTSTLARFRRDADGTMRAANLSDSDRDDIKEGNVERFRAVIRAGSYELPTPPPYDPLEHLEPPPEGPTIGPDYNPTPYAPPEAPMPEPLEPDPPPDMDVEVEFSGPLTNSRPTDFSGIWDVNGLTVVGLGIRAGLQTTPEASICITQASKVLYLVTDPISEVLIQGMNSTAESLSGFYQTGKRRLDIYEAIIEKILQYVRSESDVCVVLYGHPGVLAYPTREAIRRARLEGLKARMLPAVSTEDSLFADLDIDIGAIGIQSYEATKFLVRKYQFDPSAGLVLWQVGVLGETVWNPPHRASTTRLQVLADYLKPYYGETHEVILYHAAEFPTGQPMIEYLPLGQLTQAKLVSFSTLYIPPKGHRAFNQEVADDLGFNPGWTEHSGRREAPPPSA